MTDRKTVDYAGILREQPLVPGRAGMSVSMVLDLLA
jgi:hypothetical protein